MSKNKAQQAESPLASLTNLIQTLNDRGVRYCQWKSNIRLNESLCGGTDLDLLVDPQDISVFQQILREHQVKAFQASPGKEYPSISNYLGFDPQSGSLFHLHVHEALVLGEQYVKNYHLPLEQDFLKNTRLQYSVKTPQPEVELIIFVIRSLLKYRDRDGVKEIGRYFLKKQSSGAGGFPATVIREARWLLGLTLMQQVQAQLVCWQHVIPADVVLEFLNSLQSKTLTGSQVLRLRGSLRRALQPHQRDNRGWVTLRYFQEDWRRKRKIFRPRMEKKMTLPRGGMRIALIGADGAGKSTVIQQIEGWLSWRVSVRTYYMGKSRSRLATRFAKTITSISRSGFSGCSRLFGKHSPVTRLAGRNQRFWENISFLAEGQERNLKFHKSIRDSEAGCVVLYDRYPLRDIQISDRLVDGPRIAAQWNGSVSWLERRLAKIEEGLYRQITIPDRIIALQVHPDISRVRKPDHDYETITRKASAIDQAKSAIPGLLLVEADAPIEQVVRQVKSIVWDCL